MHTLEYWESWGAQCAPFRGKGVRATCSGRSCAQRTVLCMHWSTPCSVRCTVLGPRVHTGAPGGFGCTVRTVLGSRGAGNVLGEALCTLCTVLCTHRSTRCSEPCTVCAVLSAGVHATCSVRSYAPCARCCACTRAPRARCDARGWPLGCTYWSTGGLGCTVCTVLGPTLVCNVLGEGCAVHGAAHAPEHPLPGAMHGVHGF